VLRTSAPLIGALGVTQPHAQRTPIMFYVGNVHRWLDEVIEACNDNGFPPNESIFCLALFSSLDVELLNFFRDRRKQISSYSGMNVHIFTPIIYDDVVPDDEWRILREQLIQDGIRLGPEPAILFFRLENYDASHKGKSWKSYQPDFFAAHHLSPTQEPTRLIRDLIEVCIRYRPSIERLSSELPKIMGTPNLMVNHLRSDLTREIAKSLDQPRIFLSHASADKAVVRQFADDLHYAGTRPWLDEAEINAGDSLREVISSALKASDVVLIFLSQAAAVSTWVQHEVALFVGQDESRRVIPVVLDEAGRELAARLPTTQGLLYVDASDTESRNDAIRKIINAARVARDA
jgi:TIR domain